MFHNVQSIKLTDYTLLEEEKKHSSSNLIEIIVDSHLPNTLNSPHLNQQLITEAKQAVASINAVLKLFNEYSCTSSFTLSLLTMLGSTIGWIGMGMAANRLDGPFFAAAACGLPELIFAAIAISLFLKPSFCNLVLGTSSAGLIAWIHILLSEFYGSSPLLAEGSGIMFSLGIISSIFNCSTYSDATLRSRDFSMNEINQIEAVLAQNNLLWPLDWDLTIKKNPRRYNDVIDKLCHSKDKIEEAIKHNALQRNSIFTSLPKNMVLDVNEIIMDYASDDSTLLSLQKSIP